MASLSSREAASYLRICLTTFRKRVAEGEIAYVEEGRKQVFLTADLDDYQRRHRVPSKPEVDETRVGRPRRDSITIATGLVDIFTGEPLRKEALSGY